jgi:hypothetical protein
MYLILHPIVKHHHYRWAGPVHHQSEILCVFMKTLTAPSRTVNDNALPTNAHTELKLCGFVNIVVTWQTLKNAIVCALPLCLSFEVWNVGTTYVGMSLGLYS